MVRETYHRIAREFVSLKRLVQEEMTDKQQGMAVMVLP